MGEGESWEPLKGICGPADNPSMVNASKLVAPLLAAVAIVIVTLLSVGSRAANVDSVAPFEADVPVMAGSVPPAPLARVFVQPNRATIRTVEPTESVASPLPSPEHTSSVRFEVVDEAGTPLPDASITVRGSGEPAEHRTGAEGAVDLPRVAVAGALVRASAAGRSAAFAHLGERPRGTYRLTLYPGASISGWLVMADAEPVPQGARVCAFPQGQMDRVDRDLLRMASLGRGFSSDVAPDGSFLVEGLEHGIMYQMSAFGGGVIVNDFEGVTQPIAPVEDLKVTAKYVGAVRFTLATDEPVPTRFLAAHRWQLPDLNIQRPPGPEFAWRTDLDLSNERSVYGYARLSLRLAGLCQLYRPIAPGLPEELFIASSTRAGAAQLGGKRPTAPRAEAFHRRRSGPMLEA